ncbi:16S rRNA (guanine(966)-N(2))-methyltransferase RsmD [soil metagenome]
MKKASFGTLRIIGGQWRSRKVHFPTVSGLRPTADRVRETLFNWLDPVIKDSTCIDLYAGSGALGLEALSRGAKYVTFVEQDPLALTHIEKYLAQFQAIDQAKVIQAYVPKSPLRLREKVDIAFIDPPFNQGLVESTCQWLIEQDLLNPEAYIYIEAEAKLSPLPIPSNWEIFRSKKAGNVGYHLLRISSENATPPLL